MWSCRQDQHLHVLRPWTERHRQGHREQGSRPGDRRRLLPQAARDDLPQRAAALRAQSVSLRARQHPRAGELGDRRRRRDEQGDVPGRGGRRQGRAAVAAGADPRRHHSPRGSSWAAASPACEPPATWLAPGSRWRSSSAPPLSAATRRCSTSCSPPRSRPPTSSRGSWRTCSPSPKVTIYTEAHVESVGGYVGNFVVTRAAGRRRRCPRRGARASGAAARRSCRSRATSFDAGRRTPAVKRPARGGSPSRCRHDDLRAAPMARRDRGRRGHRRHRLRPLRSAQGRVRLRAHPAGHHAPDFIRWLSAVEPGQGCPTTTAARSPGVAFIHCVGSRQAEGVNKPQADGQINEYCSRVAAPRRCRPSAICRRSARTWRPTTSTRTSAPTAADMRTTTRRASKGGTRVLALERPGAAARSQGDTRRRGAPSAQGRPHLGRGGRGAVDLVVLAVGMHAGGRRRARRRPQASRGRRPVPARRSTPSCARSSSPSPVCCWPEPARGRRTSPRRPPRLRPPAAKATALLSTGHVELDPFVAHVDADPSARAPGSAWPSARTRAPSSCTTMRTAPAGDRQPRVVLRLWRLRRRLSHAGHRSGRLDAGPVRGDGRRHRRRSGGAGAMNKSKEQREALKATLKKLREERGASVDAATYAQQAAAGRRASGRAHSPLVRPPFPAIAAATDLPTRDVLWHSPLCASTASSSSGHRRRLLYLPPRHRRPTRASDADGHPYRHRRSARHEGLRRLRHHRVLQLRQLHRRVPALSGLRRLPPAHHPLRPARAEGDVVASRELWLCYYCAECSDTCPRRGRAGRVHGVGAALRHRRLRPDDARPPPLPLGAFAWAFLAALFAALLAILLAGSPGWPTGRRHPPPLLTFVPYEAIHWLGIGVGVVGRPATVATVVNMLWSMSRAPVPGGLGLPAPRAESFPLKPGAPRAGHRHLRGVLGESRYRDCDAEKTAPAAVSPRSSLGCPLRPS